MTGAITAKLICIFVFAYAKCWFSHGMAHILTDLQRLSRTVLEENAFVSFAFRLPKILTKLGPRYIDVVLLSSKMRYGHIEHSKGWIAHVHMVAKKRSGKPRKSWDEVLLDDRKKFGMDTADPQNL